MPTKKKKPMSKTKESAIRFAFWNKLSSNVKSGVVFVVIFATVGSYYIFTSFAASSVGQTEAETLVGNGTIVSDLMASGRQALKLTTTTPATGTLTAAAPGTNIVIHAKGTQCSGAPQATITVDGTQALIASVSGTTWGDYTATVPVTQGTHTLSAAFINPYSLSGHGKNKKGACTRELYLDYIQVQDNTPPPPVAVDTEKPTVSISSPTDGAAVSGTIKLAAAATDNVAVTKVEFYIDNLLKSTVTASPFNYTWDTTTATNDIHTIKVMSYDAANNMANASTSVSVNNSTSSSGGSTPISGTKIWTDDTEDGNASDEWTQNGGGGFYNSGSYVNQSLSTDFAHTGSNSLKNTITTPPTAGLRAFRWNEPRANRDLYYEGWLYIPQKYTLNGSQQFWNLMQWKSRTTDGSRVDPLWAVYGQQDSNGIYLQLGWGWGGTPIAGPYSNSGVSGQWITPSNKVYLPVGRWVQFASFVHSSSSSSGSINYDGSIKVWIDGKLIHDLSNVTTSFANCSFNSWCGDVEWSINNYSDSLSPSPSTIYWDDAAIYRP